MTADDRPTPDPDDGDDDDGHVTEGEVVEGIDSDDGSSTSGMQDMLGSLGGLDMGSLLGSAMEMQQQMIEAQQEAAATEVEGQSGGGVVRVLTTGGFDFRQVVIDPEAVDPDDVEMLQDLVLAAIRDAVTKAVAVTESSMPSLPGMGMGMGEGMGTGGGLDLGELLGSLGTSTSEAGDDSDDT